MEQNKKPDPTAKKKIGKVITGSAKVKKKSGIQKFTDIFVAKDVGDVKTYLIEEVFIPGSKKILYELFVNGIEMFLWGEAGRMKKSSPVSKISYASFYNNDKPIIAGGGAKKTTSFDYDNIEFPTRGDADAVLMAMRDIIDQYNVVSINDLYELAEITHHNYMYANYGWLSLADASVYRSGSGYMIKLPKALPLR